VTSWIGSLSLQCSYTADVKLSIYEMGLFHIYINGLLVTIYSDLEPSWEANEIGTDTESGTRASSYTHARNVGIQNAKRGGGSQCKKTDLLHVQGSLGDGVCRDGDHETFNEVFNHALNQFASVEHRIILNVEKIFRQICI